MTTAESVRDFFKEYRELRYENSGSIGFTDVEKNAYRLSLTLEITHVDAPRYSNLKTLPENTHYGYCTLFRGSTVTDTIAIKYPKFRVFDITNNEIWQWHQATESQRISSGEIEGGFNGVGSALEEGFQLNDLLCIAFWLFTPVTGLGDALLRLRSCIDGPPPDGESVRIAESYTAFPIASPFPDIAKFKADIPCSFLWRLEAWYLADPAFYEENAPTDSSDATDGESEYPDPDQGDGDGDGDEFPDSDAPGAGRDPRDFFGGSLPPGAGVTFEVRVSADPGFCSPGIEFVSGPFGPFVGFGFPEQIIPGAVVPNCPAATFGYRVRFTDGTILGPFDQAAGVYSATIINVQVSE